MDTRWRWKIDKRAREKDRAGSICLFASLIVRALHVRSSRKLLLLVPLFLASGAVVVIGLVVAKQTCSASSIGSNL